MSDTATPTIDPPTADPALADEGKAAKRARAETIGRYVAMFAMPLIMVGMMITGYLGTMAAPTANHMPIAVVGPQAQPFANAISDAEGTAVNMSVLDTAAEARERVIDREISGAVVLDGTAATIYTASAAGSSQSTQVIALVTPQLIDEGFSVTTEDLVPLPASDMVGLGAMFLATALAMAGYLPFSVLSSNAPRLLRFRRVVPLLAGWAAVVAALVALVTGPVLGVIASEHIPAVMGIAWLGVFAIGSVQIFLTRLFGPMAVIVGMLFLMVLGMPSSNMSMSVYTMPTFYSFLHSFLPTAAIGEAMRSVLYFDGAGVWPHVLVLTIGSVVGLGATLIYDALKRRKKHTLTPVMVNMPSLHGGARPASKTWRGISLFAFPFLMVTMMISLMLGAMSDATPRDMPVALVGATSEQAQQSADGLAEQLDDMFVYTVLDDVDDARELVADRDVVAAVVLPSANEAQFTLIKNSAASMAAAQVATGVFTGIADAQQLPLVIDDTAPLAATDTNGSVAMYLGMGWVLAGFMIVVVGANAAPASRPLRKMLPILTVYAPFMASIIWLIADPITGAVSGHFPALFGVGCLTIFAVSMFALILERLLGLLAVIPAVGVLMFLGVPASNAAMSIYMEPNIFRWLYEVLPMPAAVESAKSVLYFAGTGIDQHLLTLALWAIGSLLVVSLIDIVKPVRTTSEVIMEPHFLLDRDETVEAAPAS